MPILKVNDLRDRYEQRTLRYIGRASFESRSMVIPLNLKSIRSGSTLFVSKDRSALSQRNIDELSKAVSNLTIETLDTASPIVSADLIYSVLRDAAQNDGLMETIIDVSSFRREELLVLLAVLRSFESSVGEGCDLAYVSASSMASDWLSRNVVAHRSVVGFPGEMLPSKNTRLVVMMGFEIDRARSIIENYEPADIALGMSSLSDSINTELYNRNRTFFDDLRRQFPDTRVTFNFSARDPLKAASDLEAAISFDNTMNVILAPLHTKLSTLGAGLYALKYPSIQICYAQVDEYNEETYSTPGEDIYVFKVSELLSDVRSNSSRIRG